MSNLTTNYGRKCFPSNLKLCVLPWWTLHVLLFCDAGWGWVMGKKKTLCLEKILVITHSPNVRSYVSINQLCFISVEALVGFERKFWIESRSTSQGLPYDFKSIMHFRHKAFSHDQYASTVVPRNHTISRTILGRSATATDLDFLHLNFLYCGGTNTKFIIWCAFGG